MVVAVCYQTPVGPEISFYDASSEADAGRYVVEAESRDDYIAHAFLPLKR